MHRRGPRPPTGPPPFCDGSGGLMGTIGDYWRFAQMLCNKGVGANGARVLGTRTVELMTRNHISLDDPRLREDLRT